MEEGAERGQATVEWVGLIVLVSLLVLGLLAATGRLSATGLARAIVAKLLCAADLQASCSIDPELVATYGPELAARISESAPKIVYEEGMTALPIDFRHCREALCGNGPDSGAVWRSDTGEPAVAFVHALDCRTAETRAYAASRGFDCSARRAGNLYLQYWLYYEDSTSLRDLPGEVGHHEDDWESYQVRIGPNGTDARASSHHGYNYGGGPGSWLSDAGFVHRAAWGPATGRTYVSGGSHAGHVEERRRLSAHRLALLAEGAAATAGARLAGEPRQRPPRLPRRVTVAPAPSRWTPADRLTLIPLETLGPVARRTRFGAVPPWRKPVYLDPEDEGT